MIHDLYTNKEEIENWLNEYSIKNYELIKDKKYGYIVDVYEDVYLDHKYLRKIPIKFNIVYGNFSIAGNELNSLEGSPNEVKKNFNCSFNKLTSLKNCPKIIHGNFDVECNYLNRLSYLPEIIKGEFFIKAGNIRLKEQRNISFEDLKNINERKKINKQLNKELNQEIVIDNNIKNIKIKI